MLSHLQLKDILLLKLNWSSMLIKWKVETETKEVENAYRKF